MQKKFLNNVEAEIGQKYLEGSTIDELSKEYQSGRKSIANAIRRQNIKLRPRGYQGRTFSEQEKLAIKAAWDLGKKQPEIAKEFQAAQQTISDILRKMGCETRRTRAGTKNVLWRESRFKNQDGYVYIKLHHSDPLNCMAHDEHYGLEHRIVVARSLNRPLESHETVHHINGDRADNRLENLQLRSGRHGKGVACKCKQCGSTDIEYTSV